jgi:hypothetical protein
VQLNVVEAACALLLTQQAKQVVSECYLVAVEAVSAAHHCLHVTRHDTSQT